MSCLRSQNSTNSGCVEAVFELKHGVKQTAEYQSSLGTFGLQLWGGVYSPWVLDPPVRLIWTLRAILSAS